MKSIDARIANINCEVETITNAFIHAQSELLQLTIEKKMKEQEILLADLQQQKAQIMHERGQRLTVDKILDFIAKLVQGDPNDKEYQHLLIDNLVLQVYIFDDDVVPIFNIGVDKSLERLREQETEQLIDYINEVQVQTAMLHQKRQNPNRIVFHCMCFMCGTILGLFLYFMKYNNSDLTLLQCKFGLGGLQQLLQL